MYDSRTYTYTQNRCNSWSYQYLANLLAPIKKKLYYFTFSNNCDVIPSSEALSYSIFIFDDVRQTGRDKRVWYFAMGQRLLPSLSDVCKDTKHFIRNANVIYWFCSNRIVPIWNACTNIDMSYENFYNLNVDSKSMDF